MAKKKKESIKASKEKKKKNKKKDTRQLSESFLKMIAPLGNIEFNSDYFRTGLYYGVVLTFVADAGSVQGLPPMWGSKLIPVVSSDDAEETVTARLVTSMQARSKKWFKDRASDATHVTAGAYIDAENSSQGLEASKRQQQAIDNAVVMNELAAQASYLDVTYKIVLYATSKEALDIAIRLLGNHYKSIFGSVRLTRYIGEQQQDFEQLLYPAIDKLGHHDGYTSTELAGFYPFVGKGWVDPAGDYIGISANDIHQMPVIWNTETIKRMCVIASNDKIHCLDQDEKRGYLDAMGAAGWGTFITQSEMLAGRNVYELVLNDEQLSEIGRDLSASSIVTKADVSLVNPLQAFGMVTDELQLFNMLLDKLCLMLQQQNPEFTKQDMDMFRQAVTDFFVQEGLWAHNAAENRDRLRLVGLSDPEHLPKADRLLIYLKRQFDDFSTGTHTRKPNALAASIFQRLIASFSAWISEYGYLFNESTSLNLNEYAAKQRKVFEFGSLQRSGQHVVMMQFVNLFSFVTSSMKPGDSLHIYGCDLITPQVWAYIQGQLTYLWGRNIRLVLGFNTTSSALNNILFDQADTCIMGQMSQTDISEYAEHITGSLPDPLVNAMTSGDDRIYYLRRNAENMPFYWDRTF